MTSETSIEADTPAPTVLIVEDERPLADLYAVWLTETYSVRIANDGEAALERLTDDVAVVLLDRRMPRSSGDEVLEKIRERGYDCRVAMVSGIDPDFDIIEMEVDEYLTKPVSKSVLRETVDRLLERATCDRRLLEYFALESKRAALVAEKVHVDLDGHEEYGALTGKIAEELDRLDTLLAELDEGDFRALLGEHALPERDP